MNRLIISFFITLVLYSILFFMLYAELKNRPLSLPQRNRLNISNLAIIPHKSVVKKPTPKPPSPKPVTPQPKHPKKIEKITKKLTKRKRKITKKSIKKKIPSSQHKIITKNDRNVSTPLPSLTQLFAKKSHPHSSNTLPPQIKRLYKKDEFDTFTKTQKEFIKNNLAKIGMITQKYLYLRGYPYIAIKMKEEGVNIVEFYLHPNGDITGLRLVTSSGYEALDKNSIETIKAAYKDYPLPPQTTKIKIYVRYSIIY